MLYYLRESSFRSWGVFGLADVKDLSSVTLAGLTLLAFSQVRTRRLVMLSPQTGRVGQAFLTSFPPDVYERRVSERHSYIFIGITGTRSMTVGRADFQRMLDRGADLRFLLLDFENFELVQSATISGRQRSSPGAQS